MLSQLFFIPILANNLLLDPASPGRLHSIGVGIGRSVYSPTGSVYELNKIDLFRDIFMWAYDRSTARYSAIRQQVGQPDIFKMQYRERIKGLISEIIMKALDMGKVQQKIEETANQLPGFDRVKFVEAVETELLSIHDGNFHVIWQGHLNTKNGEWFGLV